ncbi:MAG: hypothetical protein NC240_09895, partial [Clostridium sp.]|nr:hypothetical protein [Clostridium sp.]
DMPLEEAVPKAVDECINEGILKEFLLLNKAEVVNMSIFEYDAELHMQMEREEAFEDGMEQGIERGNKQSALRMIEAGKLSLEEIALYSNLTLEQVLELEKELQSV